MIIGIIHEGKKYSFDTFNKKNDLTDLLPSIILKQVKDNVREWEGKPHVTDLCIDTREAYLKYTTEYYEELLSVIRTTFGSLRHASVLNDDLSEIKLNSIDISGSADNIDVRPNGDIFVCDFKFYSSYSVAKQLGISVTKNNVIDDFGNKVFYANGKPKQESIKTFTPPNKMYVTLQLNIYRHLLEDVILSSAKNNGKLYNALKYAGAHIDENIKAGKIFDGMGVFMFVTDGGTYMAKNRGIDQMSYYDKDIDYIPQIDTIIERKVKALNYAMENRIVPPLCKDVYCMDDRYKCNNFCPVRDVCKQLGGDLPPKPF